MYVPLASHQQPIHLNEFVSTSIIQQCCNRLATRKSWSTA